MLLTKHPIAQTQYTYHHVKAGKTHAYQISTVAKTGKPPLRSERMLPKVVTAPRSVN